MRKVQSSKNSSPDAHGVLTSHPNLRAWANKQRKLLLSPYSWSDRGNSNIGFAQQRRLYRCVQICIFGDGVQGKGRPSPASAIQKSQRRAHFCFLPSTGNSASAVRKDGDEIFCRLPRMEADRGVPRLRVLSPNTRCLKSESRTAGRALLPERILRRRSETREANILNDVLDGFRGILVSDFYAAYDSAPCAQQKCLIHLMRDINEDLRKNPFDDELKVIASRFGTLLREIVETIDTHGLKVRHLSKHRRSAEEFVEHVVAMKCTTEAGLSLKKRIEKNRNKLFTFLNYDGVPWNNNNAEHAVRAFTRLRNLINTSTPKGTREFATLLSIQQTLRYRGKSLLEFMRSGRMEIDG